MNWSAGLLVFESALAAGTAEYVIGSLIIAVSVVLGLSLVVRPQLLYGTPDTSWGQLCIEKGLLIGNSFRVIGLAALLGGGYYGVTFFMQAPPPEIETETQATPPPTLEADLINQMVLDALEKIAPGEYSLYRTKSGGTSIQWLDNISGERRFYAGTTIIGNTRFHPDDVPHFASEFHRDYSQPIKQRYPLYDFALVKDDIIPRVLDVWADSPTQQAYREMDPNIEVPWYSMRLVYHIDGTEGRPAREVRQSMLRRWGRSASDLWPLAVANLRRKFETIKSEIRITDEGEMKVMTDTSMILTAYVALPDFNVRIGNVLGAREFYFTMPTRYIMIISPARPELLKPMQALSKEQFDATPRDLSLYTLTTSIFHSTPSGVVEITESEINASGS